MTKQLYLLWVNSAVKDVFGWKLSDKNEKEFREAFYWINYKGIKTYIKLPLKRDFNRVFNRDFNRDFNVISTQDTEVIAKNIINTKNTKNSKKDKNEILIVSRRDNLNVKGHTKISF